MGNNEATSKRNWQEMTSASGRKFRVRKGTGVLFPVISVVVPIYNAEYTLAQALDSICAQDLSGIEIVCIDDKSTDESRNIIDDYAAELDNITVVEHIENAGYGAAMNDGIQAASGKWIAILEPDDYVLPGTFQAMMKAAAKHPTEVIDIIKCPYVREVREEGTRRGDAPKRLLNCSYRRRIHPKSQPFAMTDPSANHLLRHHPSIWSAIYLRSFLEEKGIDFVEYPGSGWADNEFFYKTMLGADAILYLDEPFYVYREETDGEFDAFAKANKRLPFDRWHSMGEVISGYGLDSNDDIMRSHISKGFTYLSGELGANGEDDEVMQEEMKKMFDSMNEDLVISEPKINPHLKDLFFESRKHETEDGCESSSEIGKPSKIAYYLGLVGEFGYAVRNNGIGFAIGQVKKVLGGR